MEIFGIWDKGIGTIAGNVQASKSFMLKTKRESAALREVLIGEQARCAALGAAFVTYKLESETTLAAKDTTLVANAEAI